MKTHLYTLPAKGSAPLAIVATQPCRGLEIAEDDAATEQGIVLFTSGDNYTQGYTYAPSNQPVLKGFMATGGGRPGGSFLGLPIQKDQGGTVTLRAADVLFKATSATSTPTNIRVVEYD